MHGLFPWLIGVLWVRIKGVAVAGARRCYGKESSRGGWQRSRWWQRGGWPERLDGKEG
ncbi:hypothetical protein OIU84_023212 [Salix udensis]|uniref:Glycine-rich protein n=1 Tax=Salix udensis TaxID=889485 RepID=A0AAD6KQB5_9ROSI|nr:hypothetical protein OIU84_023212 [Salix udensis]